MNKTIYVAIFQFGHFYQFKKTFQIQFLINLLVPTIIFISTEDDSSRVGQSK